MKRMLLMILFTTTMAYSQEQGYPNHQQPNGSLEPAEADSESLFGNMLEALSEQQDADPEDDHQQQQLLYYRHHPISLNASPEVLTEFPLLDERLIQNLLQYRKRFGNLVSIYELQAVPGFSLEVIKPILPYVTIEWDGLSIPSLKKRLEGGKSQWLFRPAIALQRTEGYTTSNENNRFAGSSTYLLTRYKYQFRDLLQMGFTAEKDAGEPLVSSKGFPLTDFSSVHLFIRKAGIIKALAIGDYTVNFGQGLILWQSQSFGKTAAVVNVKRHAAILRPYQSTGEHNFFRGAAATFALRKFEVAIFSSWRKLTANTTEDPDLGRVFSSVNTSGLHRSPSEWNDKSAVLQASQGGNITWSHPSGRIGVNLVRNSYSLPLKRRDEPYNVFSIRGRRWINGSIDYSYTLDNHLFFGEVAVDKAGNGAMIVGMISSLGKMVDISFVNRFISRGYQSLFGSAFTENTLPSNERGTYCGLSIKPAKAWQLDVYADIFLFPWLRYRVNAPFWGHEYQAQLSWKPSRNAEIYSRCRFRSKPLNAPGTFGIDYPEPTRNLNWRTHFAYQVSRAVILRARMEICTFSHPKIKKPEYGSLFYTDAIYKPEKTGCSVNLRLQFFETDSYNTRIYAYENDLYLASSIPSFSDKGTRYCLNFKARLAHKIFNSNQLILSLKFSSSLYPDKENIGSGLSAIHGNRRSDLKMQLFLAPAY